MGADEEMIVRPPLERPAPPIPATALPMMSIVELCATPQRRDPTSNKPKKNMKVH